MVKRLFLSLIRQYLFWMTFFFILRAIFIVYHVKLIEAENISAGETLLSFWYALRLDMATAAYILLLPALILFIQGLFKAGWLNVVNKLYTLLLIFAWSLITAVELGSFSEWKYKLNAGAFLGMNNAREGIFSLSFFHVLFLLLFLIVVAGGSFIAYIRIFYLKIEERARQIIIPFIFLIISVPSLFVMLRGGFNDISISESSAFYSNHSILNWFAVNSGYHLAVNYMETSRYKKSNNYQFFPVEEARLTADQILKAEKDTTVNILKFDRPNIIVLLMESWTADIIESLGANPGITPEFAKLEEEGLLFTQFYCSGNRSHEGIASLLGGHPALPYTTYTANPVKFTGLPSMVQMIRKEGYFTSFHYGGQLNYGNLRAYLHYNQFDKIVEESDIDQSIPRGRLGVHDEFMYARLIADLKDFKEPLFSILFTLSSHSPYDFPMEPVIDWAGNENKFFNSAYYADKCLGDFFEIAKQQPWFNNTLFIIIADHGHNSNKNHRYESYEYHRIPLLFYGNALKENFRGKQSGRIADNSSMAKTLLKQLNLPDMDFKWGSDIFNPYSPEFAYVVLNDGYMWKTPEGEVVYSMMWKHYYSKKFPAGTSPEQINSFTRNGKSYVQALFQDFLDH
jgi:phosphoglycerol transferase MdoB-like AlkP superfamily enzyme